MGVLPNLYGIQPNLLLLFQSGYPPYPTRIAQYPDVSIVMIYTHVLNKGGKGVVSQLDR